jgi:hypothetical protein
VDAGQTLPFWSPWRRLKDSKPHRLPIYPKGIVKGAAGRGTEPPRHDNLATNFVVNFVEIIYHEDRQEIPLLIRADQR